jgi:hypothetical protein
VSLRSTIAEEGENGGGFGFLQRKNRKNRLNIPGGFAGGVDDGGDDGVDGADDAEEEDMDGTDMLSIVLRRLFLVLVLAVQCRCSTTIVGQTKTVNELLSS